MKIKKVEIQAFKSYLEQVDGTFDFTLPNSGDAANFSSIYAPNGFGKTSFFDAVDYAITGKIGRFSRDVTLRNRYGRDAQQINEQGQRQYLVRNKAAGAKDTDVQVYPLTEILVHTSNRTHPFESDYHFPKRGSVDYKFPPVCNPGTKFFERLLLSQEAIDAFLRETTPEKRYEKFVDMVGGLSGENKKRRSLLAVKSEMQKAADELRKDAEKCDSDLMAAKTRENPIERANQLIAEINQIAEEPLPQFDVQHNQELHDELLIQLVSLEEQWSVSIREFDRKKASVERQQNSLLETQRKVELLTMLKESEAYLNQAIDDAENIKPLESKKIAVQSEIDQFSGQLKAVQQFSDQVHEFVEQQSSLRKLEKEQSELAKEVVPLTNKKKADEAELKLKRVSYGKAKEDLERLKIESETAKERFEKLSILRAERDELSKLLNAYKPHQQQERLNGLERKLEQVSALKISSPIQKDILDRFEESDREVLLEAQREYIAVDLECLEASKQLKDKKKQLKGTQGQATEIRTLIELASSIVTTTQRSTCPVCQHDYKDVQLLQQRIADNPVLGELEKQLTQRIQELQSEIHSCDKTLSALQQVFDKIVDEQKTFFERIYKETERDQRDQKDRHECSVKSFSQNADQIRVLSEKLLNKSEGEYELFIAEKLKSAKQQAATVSSSIAEIEEALDSSGTILSDFEEEQSKLTFRKEQQAILVMPFVALRSYLESLAVSPDNSENELKEFLRKQQIYWLEKLEGENEKRAELEKQITQLIERRSVVDRESSLDGLVKKRAGVVGQIITRNEELATFKELMKQMSMSVPEDVSKWTHCKEAIEQYISQQVDGIAKMLKAQGAITSIKRISKMAVEFHDPQILQSQLNELNTQLKAHKLIIDALQGDVDKISRYIRETTDAYFRTNLINQLYAAIDPHPEFKKIQFECNMDDDRPKLHISAANRDNSDQVCPTLTFSSAQINVLALSIFLAQALTTTDDEGKNVDCIFIDDPVQSVDSINSLSFIDLMRAICLRFDKQIIVSTHDENFHELLKKKIPPNVLPAKYLKLASFGQVVEDRD